jgi:hypothetical protein
MSRFRLPVPVKETRPCLSSSPPESCDAPYGTKLGGNGPGPTRSTYGWLVALYDYFNRELFNEQLPNCLISLQRKRGARGYFDARRFAANEGGDLCDEIALNPRHWGPPSPEKESISTLVHEQVHLWQAHFGMPGRGDYHNREFARKMFEVGLVSSSTGKRGGRTTGRRMSHYIFSGGPFERACDRLLQRGFRIPYIEVPAEGGTLDFNEKRRVGRAESKTAYICPNCAPPVRVWGKPRLRIICGCCDSPFVRDGLPE